MSSKNSRDRKPHRFPVPAALRNSAAHIAGVLIAVEVGAVGALAAAGLVLLLSLAVVVLAAGGLEILLLIHVPHLLSIDFTLTIPLTALVYPLPLQKICAIISGEMIDSKESRCKLYGKKGTHR